MDEHELLSIYKYIIVITKYECLVVFLRRVFWTFTHFILEKLSTILFSNLHFANKNIVMAGNAYG